MPTPAIIILIIAAFVATTTDATCIGPIATWGSYATPDATILTHITYISNFTVRCATGTPGPLYAVVGNAGGLFPVASVAPGRYQISWTEDVRTASSAGRGGGGDEIGIKVYDEEGFSSLRKAQRMGDDPGAVPPVARVALRQTGTYRGPWISCECLAVAALLVCSYYAVSFKAKVLE